MIVNWFDALSREIDAVERYMDGDNFKGFGVSKYSSHFHPEQTSSHWFVVEPGGDQWNIGEVKRPDWDEELYQQIKDQIQQHLMELFLGAREPE